MSDYPVVIDVRDVKKKFRIYYDRGLTLKEKVLFKQRRTYEDHWVLNGISFQVHKGEAIGLVGENGCGKSTTLKMLTKILYPDAGTITMDGRVSSLIELGAGFHPDMSGRENIYTNASIFGLKHDEIDKRLNDIIDFSELGAYIDNPVRTYSSGMYTRLAFAVAINVDADILLIDEILAVGDVGFQEKCFNKLREIKRNGTTIVIVSHALGQIEKICERSFWIENGLIRSEGNPIEVHKKYLQFIAERTGNLSKHNDTLLEKKQKSSVQQNTNVKKVNDQKTIQTEKKTASEKRWGNLDITFTSVKLLNIENQVTDRLMIGEDFSIRMDYKINKPVENLQVGIGIFRNDGLQCYGTNTFIEHIKVEPSEKQGCVIVAITNNPLIEGSYLLDVAFEKEGGFPYDYFRECIRFTVHSEIKDVGVARLTHTWRFVDEIS